MLTSQNFASKEEQLLESIVQWCTERVASHHFDEPAFFVCVAYDPSCEGFPSPVIAAGLASEREALARKPSTLHWLEKLGPAARESFYNPAHFKNFDVAALRSGRGAIDELGERLHERGVRWDHFYFTLGQHLAIIDWKSHLQITPDFAAFTTDIQQSVWTHNFAASVPRETRAALARNGWIPDNLAH